MNKNALTPALVALATAAGCWSGSAMALDFEAQVSAAVIYSDNIELSQDDEEGEFVYQLNPGFTLGAQGSRYDFNLDYRLEMLYFQDQEDDTEVFNRGDAALDLALIPDFFYLGTRGTIEQVVTDPARNYSSTNIPVTANRTDAVTLSATPSIRREILGSQLNLAYTVGRVDYDDEQRLGINGDPVPIQDVKFHSADSSLTGPERERGLSWSLRHQYRRYEYDLPPDAEWQKAMASVYWNLGGGWAPFASGGMESDLDDQTDASLEDGIWEAGLRRLGTDLEFEVAFGERSFGSSFRGRLEQRIGGDDRDFIRITYSEEPRTTEQVSLETRPALPGTPGDPLPPYLVAPGSGAFFRQDRAELALGVGLVKNSFRLTVYREENERLGEDGPQPSVPTAVDSDQVGLTFTWLYDIGARTQASATVLVAEREYEDPDGTTDDDRVTSLRAAIERELGRRTSINFWLAREKRSGSQFSGQNYTENQVGISLDRSFF
jgi:hypothetical protein